MKVGKKWGGVNFQHVGVYLGKKQVCHVWDPDIKSNNKVRIDSWRMFLIDRTNSPERHHCIIPFKNFNTMVKQIAKAVVEKYREGNYDILGSNCENFANMIVHGLDFSQQGEKFSKGYITKSFSSIESYYSRHNIVQMLANEREWEKRADIEFDLKNKIKETNDKLDNLAKYKNSEVENKIKEIKNYDENEWNLLIEIPSRFI